MVRHWMLWNYKGFGEAVCSFISAIYKSGWDTLPVDEYNNSIRKFIASKFTSKSLKIKVGSTSGNFKKKQWKSSNFPSYPYMLT